MIYLPIILIALIQGVTEFIPVSSSGHITLFQNLMSFIGIDGFHLSKIDRLRLEIAVHFGSLIAVILYLWKDCLKIIVDFFKALFGKWSQNSILAFHILLASIPVCIFGAFFYKKIAYNLHSIYIIAWATFGFGLILFICDRFKTQYSLSVMKWPHALFIGLCQICALIPGASRSGVCISGARILGFNRFESARFSLLLSIPILLAASAVAVYDHSHSHSFYISSTMYYGALFGFISSFIAILLFMSWIKRASFTPFVIYRVLLGGGLLLWLYVF